MRQRHPSFLCWGAQLHPHQSPVPTDKYLSHFLVLLHQAVVMNSTVTILIFDSISLGYIFRSGIAGAQGKQVPPQSSYEPSKAMYGGVWFPSTNGVHLCGLQIRNVLKKLQHVLFLVSKRLSIFHALVKGHLHYSFCKLFFYKSPIFYPERPAQGPWRMSNAYLLNEQDPTGKTRGWTSRAFA